jgi:hypothetical protein
VGDVRATLEYLLPKVSERSDTLFLEMHLGETRRCNDLLNHSVERGPGIKPIRPEFLAATLSGLASDDAMFFADTGTACIWLARHLKGGMKRRLFGSFSWAGVGEQPVERYTCNALGRSSASLKKPVLPLAPSLRIGDSATNQGRVHRTGIQNGNAHSVAGKFQP